VTAFVDTNVLVRHLTGDPPELAGRATRYLAAADELLLPDLILAEVAYVLESFYESPLPRWRQPCGPCWHSPRSG
jgi:predicted nucleic acid-binding protein